MKVEIWSSPKPLTFHGEDVRRYLSCTLQDHSLKLSVISWWRFSQKKKKSTKREGEKNKAKTHPRKINACIPNRAAGWSQHTLIFSCRQSLKVVVHLFSIKHIYVEDKKLPKLLLFAPLCLSWGTLGLLSLLYFYFLNSETLGWIRDFNKLSWSYLKLK